MENDDVAHTSVALIMGVTGMAGLSLAESLKKDSAPGGPWKVYGAARRPMPTWFPTSTFDEYVAFDATSYEDTVAKISPLSSHVTHVFWVAIQVRGSEDENIAVNSLMLENVLHVLLEGLPCPSLRHVTLQTGTSYYMGPSHVYSDKFVTHEAPFREDLPRLPYKHFYYPLEDLVASYSKAKPITYSIHRGISSRSFYNSLLCVLMQVYANMKVCPLGTF